MFPVRAGEQTVQRLHLPHSSFTPEEPGEPSPAEENSETWLKEAHETTLSSDDLVIYELLFFAL